MINEFVLMNNKTTDINSLIAKIHKNTQARVTIIDKNGVVKFESNRSTKGMENHLHRPEIEQSLKHEFGSSVRHSVSVGVDFLYVAKRVDDHFIRMAYSLGQIKSKFLRFWLTTIALFSLVLFVSLFIAWRINKKITFDLKAINESLENLLKKNYERDFNSVKCCKEFDIISKRIEKVSRRLEKRDKQKNKYTKKLKELSKKQGDIISAISHEFKNPIAAVMGYAQSVKDDDMLSHEIRDKFLDKVIKNAHKISNMIDRLAMAIKFENDTFIPEFSKFKLLSLIEDVKETLLQKYRGRDIMIAVEDIYINADRVMFENLLINLMENALKYSEDTVHVELKNSELSINDSGIGIEEEDINNITKRFFRVDSLTWDNSIGVGLYIVKYILKLHNSELEIKSKIGVGSKFYFDIKYLTISKTNQ